MTKRLKSTPFSLMQLSDAGAKRKIKISRHSFGGEGRQKDVRSVRITCHRWQIELLKKRRSQLIGIGRYLTVFSLCSSFFLFLNLMSLSFFHCSFHLIFNDFLLVVQSLFSKKVDLKYASDNVLHVFTSSLIWSPHVLLFLLFCSWKQKCYNTGLFFEAIYFVFRAYFAQQPYPFSSNQFQVHIYLFFKQKIIFLLYFCVLSLVKAFLSIVYTEINTINHFSCSFQSIELLNQINFNQG